MLTADVYSYSALSMSSGPGCLIGRSVIGAAVRLVRDADEVAVRVDRRVHF